MQAHYAIMQQVGSGAWDHMASPHGHTPCMSQCNKTTTSRSMCNHHDYLQSTGNHLLALLLQKPAPLYHSCHCCHCQGLHLQTYALQQACRHRHHLTRSLHYHHCLVHCWHRPFTLLSAQTSPGCLQHSKHSNQHYNGQPTQVDKHAKRAKVSN